MHSSLVEGVVEAAAVFVAEVGVVAALDSVEDEGEGLAKSLRTFLVRTSVTAVVNLGICNEIVQNHQSQTLLRVEQKVPSRNLLR